jgi:1-acyl-sn-glycerol-3-phosphate acyltransferase
MRAVLELEPSTKAAIMSNPVVSAVKGCIAGLVLFVNTLVCFSAMIPFALIKLLLPFTAVRKVVDFILNKFIAETWIGINSLWMRGVQGKPWQISGMENFSTKGWYLVCANHQSWVDILVLQRVFNRRIPLLKFFLKYELIYVPIMGLAWWALDFPFMRRKGGKSLAKDIETARKSCEKFRIIPTSVISFAEGTRFTQAKHDQQKAPYQHLLKPKTGGLAMALETMGEQFDALVDVTIIYPAGVPTFIDLLCGRVADVIVDVKQVKIPAALANSDNAVKPEYRTQLQGWINELWGQKDRRIGQLKAGQR